MQICSLSHSTRCSTDRRTEIPSLGLLSFCSICSLSLPLSLSFWLGSVAGPEKLQPLLDKNQEMFNAFVKAVEELAVLRNNLNKTEVSDT